MARVAEVAQDELGWWSGLALSAFQPDDLSAVLYMCLEDAGQLESRHPLQRDRAMLLRRWKREGVAIAAQRLDQLSAPDTALLGSRASAFLRLVRQAPVTPIQ